MGVQWFGIVKLETKELNRICDKIVFKRHWGFLEGQGGGAGCVYQNALQSFRPIAKALTDTIECLNEVEKLLLQVTCVK